MPKKLWYQEIPDPSGYESLDVVAEFLAIWLNTRLQHAIDPGELAGVIDVLYDCAPPGTIWTTLEVRPDEMAKYITTYMKDDGEGGDMMKGRDEKLSAKYKEWIEKGHEPPPILLSGVTDEDGSRGIMLIDGRHRIFSAIDAGLKTIKAYLPIEQVECMKDAEL